MIQRPTDTSSYVILYRHTDRQSIILYTYMFVLSKHYFIFQSYLSFSKVFILRQTVALLPQHFIDTQTAVNYTLLVII